MKKALKIIAILVALLVLALSWPAYKIYGELSKARSEDPLVWQEDIQALEDSTRDLYGAGEAVVFIGSSSIRLWSSLEQDMAPIPVIQHGFGGAKLNDLVYYAQRLVNAYRPRAVVVFAGTNDIDPAASKSPGVLLASYQEFIGRIRADQPKLPVFYIGITPSVLRWDVWSIARETNELIRQWSGGEENLFFIDTSSALLGNNGEPDPDNYVFDGLHLSARGYAIWTDFIKPPLLAELAL